MIGAPAERRPMKFPAKLITAKSIFYGRCLVTHKLPLLTFLYAMIYILLIYYPIVSVIKYQLNYQKYPQNVSKRA